MSKHDFRKIDENQSQDMWGENFMFPSDVNSNKNQKFNIKLDRRLQIHFELINWSKTWSTFNAEKKYFFVKT